MVFRFLIRLLANNERLVQRLSESYPIRRAARVVVSLWFRGQRAVKDSGVAEKVAKGDIKSLGGFVSRFKNNLKEEIENAKRDMKKQQK